MYINIRNRIKMALSDRKMSASQLSELVGYDKNNMTHFLRGERPIPFNTLEKIFEILQL